VARPGASCVSSPGIPGDRLRARSHVLGPAPAAALAWRAELQGGGGHNGDVEQLGVIRLHGTVARVHLGHRFAEVGRRKRQARLVGEHPPVRRGARDRVKPGTAIVYRMAVAISGVKGEASAAWHRYVVREGDGVRLVALICGGDRATRPGEGVEVVVLELTSGGVLDYKLVDVEVAEVDRFATRVESVG
jgi:hypothetical protein